MDLLNPAEIQRIIADIETSQNSERREREIKAFEVYSGELKHHVETRIKEIYPKTYGSFSVADLNMSKKVTDKLSKAYKKNPLRTLATEKETQQGHRERNRAVNAGMGVGSRAEKRSGYDQITQPPAQQLPLIQGPLLVFKAGNIGNKFREQEHQQYH